MIVIGDSFHNFTDGIIIAGAFLADVKLGIVTAAAIVAHEVPQEVGDFLVLLNSGFSKAKALAAQRALEPRGRGRRAARLLHAFRRAGVGAAGARDRRREHDLRRGRRPHSRAAAAHPARGIAHAGGVHRAGHPHHVGRAPARRAWRIREFPRGFLDTPRPPPKIRAKIPEYSKGLRRNPAHIPHAQIAYPACRAHRRPARQVAREDRLLDARRQSHAPRDVGIRRRLPRLARVGVGEAADAHGPAGALHAGADEPLDARASSPTARRRRPSARSPTSASARRNGTSIRSSATSATPTCSPRR